MVYADLRGAGLVGANLRNTRMTAADLTDSFLMDSDLRGAGLISTNLSNAHLNGADLRGAFVSVKQVVSACLDDTTRLPTEFAKDPRVAHRIAECEASILRPKRLDR